MDLSSLRLLLLCEAAPLVDFQMEQLCKVNGLLWVLLI